MIEPQKIYSLIKDLSASQIKIYLYMLSKMNSANECIIIIDSLKKQCQVKSLNTIYKAINTLEQEGLIEKHGTLYRAGNKTKNAYAADK